MVVVEGGGLWVVGKTGLMIEEGKTFISYALGNTMDCGIYYLMSLHGLRWWLAACQWELSAKWRRVDNTSLTVKTRHHTRNQALILAVGMFDLRMLWRVGVSG